MPLVGYYHSSPRILWSIGKDQTSRGDGKLPLCKFHKGPTITLPSVSQLRYPNRRMDTVFWSFGRTVSLLWKKLGIQVLRPKCIAKCLLSDCCKHRSCNPGTKFSWYEQGQLEILLIVLVLRISGICKPQIKSASNLGTSQYHSRLISVLPGDEDCLTLWWSQRKKPSSR